MGRKKKEIENSDLCKKIRNKRKYIEVKVIIFLFLGVGNVIFCGNVFLFVHGFSASLSVEFESVFTEIQL